MAEQARTKFAYQAPSRAVVKKDVPPKPVLSMEELKAAQEKNIAEMHNAIAKLHDATDNNSLWQIKGQLEVLMSKCFDNTVEMNKIRNAGLLNTAKGKQQHETKTH